MKTVTVTVLKSVFLASINHDFDVISASEQEALNTYMDENDIVSFLAPDDLDTDFRTCDVTNEIGDCVKVEALLKEEPIKLEILIKPVSEFGKRNDIAIHALEPSYNELLRFIEDALNKGFPLIVIYTRHGFATRSNIKASQSTWNRLIREFENADVRAGEVGFKHGSSIGDGFTLYFPESV